MAPGCVASYDVTVVWLCQCSCCRTVQAAIADPENAISYCYCSIFDDCWLADSRLDALSPEPVQQCPDFGEATFRN